MLNEALCKIVNLYDIFAKQSAQNDIFYEASPNAIAFFFNKLRSIREELGI